MSYNTGRRGRGVFIGARGRGNFSNVRPHNPLVQLEESPFPPLGDLIEAIDAKAFEDIDDDEGTQFGMKDVEPIASYNWVDQKAPKIVVPGCPPLWKPLTDHPKLQEDNGVYYRDDNSAFFPEHPLEPAIVSVMKVHPDSFDIDIVGCNSTLGNLLRFILGVECTFRMLVEVVGKTVHLVRRERSPKEQMIGVRGFGHTFPEAYTTWASDVRPSKSHHRIVRCRFGKLDLLMRQSSDGYIGEDKDKSPPTATPSSTADEDIANLLGDLSIKSSPAKSTRFGQLEVVDGGWLTPQSSAFDLKTRSIKAIDRDTLGEELPRLWMMQTPNFILAHHRSGTFCNIDVSDIRDDIENWEKSHQADLRRLSALLHRIITTAFEKNNTLLEIVRVQGGSLEIRERLPDVGVAFSAEVKEKWLKWLGNAEEDTEEEIDDDSDSGSGDFTECNEECGYCGKCSS
ncbi:hypothetical protein TGAMA5MH_09685 [Trichoderma gamsii]|uniref:Geranylgeranyl pyrophosphate synthetase n=1 Tax=Trichoderma gamsii TaxID=398673 RepID=A0A2K0SYH1_9HYPO|nr:hypothetical protein TGAMA5MH_09685 [Trichoderma gamsii]